MLPQVPASALLITRHPTKITKIPTSYIHVGKVTDHEIVSTDPLRTIQEKLVVKLYPHSTQKGAFDHKV